MVFHDANQDTIQVYNEKHELVDTIGFLLTQDNQRVDIKDVHSIEFSPDPKTPDLVLIASQGTERLVEFNYKTKKINWMWNPWVNGFSTNQLGLTMIAQGDDVDTTGLSEVSFAEAKRRIVENDRLYPEDKFFKDEFLVVDLNNLKPLLGLEPWQLVLQLNSVFYSKEPGMVMATSFITGETFEVDKKTGEATRIPGESRTKPHGFLPFRAGYIETDTGGAKVVFHSYDLIPKIVYDFSKFSGKAEGDSEWLQYSFPISEELIATIDFARNRVFVWNAFTEQVSMYPYSKDLVVQTIVPVDRNRKNEDAAMAIDEFGGIDLNRKHLDLQIKRDGKGVVLPMAEQSIEALQNIEGFIPVIINIAPVMNMPMLLGFTDTEEDIKDTRSLSKANKLEEEV